MGFESNRGLFFEPKLRSFPAANRHGRPPVYIERGALQLAPMKVGGNGERAEDGKIMLGLDFDDHTWPAVQAKGENSRRHQGS
jgi:hypothetical protein